MNGFIKARLSDVNQLFERWMEKRSREIRMPESVESFEDIPYLDTGLDCHRIDIFRPKHAGGKLPVVVNFHGGGLLLCTRKVNRPFCWELAKRGFLVFCVDYPLVPDSNVPGILRDAAWGMDRVAELLEEYGGDRERVYLAGDSAGAMIGVYELAMQRNPKIGEALYMQPSSLKVRAAAFISGMFYTARMDSVGAYLRQEFYGRDWKKQLFYPYVNPDVPEVAGKLPSVILVTSKMDNLRNYTMAFVKGLKRAGIPHKLLDLPWDPEMNHDFVIIKPEGQKAQKVIEEICTFLNEN